MTSYRYSAFSLDGKLETGVLDAATESEALEHLIALKLTVVELTLNQDRSSRRYARAVVPLAMQADLADQLSVLFGAALPAPKVVDIIATSNGDPTIRRHFLRMGQLMADGVDFSDAMAQASEALSPLFAILIRIGQHAGKPGIQMSQLAAVFRRQERMLAHVRGALIYPAILLIGGMGIIVMMSLFLAPRLEVIFSSVNQPVPDAIAIFTRLGALLQVWGLPLVIISAIILTWAVRNLRHPSPQIRTFSQGLPLIGPILRGSALARIVRAVQLMLEAGIPLAQALFEVVASFPDEPQTKPFHQAATALEDGARASSVLTENLKLPVLLRELFQIGEETNSLPHILNSVAVSLENDVERNLQRLMALLTPTLTLLIGSMIALIVASVMGAVLSVNDLAF